MGSVEEKVKTGGVGVGVGGGMVVGGQTLVAEMKLLKEMQEHSGLFHFSFWKIIFFTFWLHFNVMLVCLMVSIFQGSERL